MSSPEDILQIKRGDLDTLLGIAARGPGDSRTEGALSSYVMNLTTRIKQFTTVIDPSATKTPASRQQLKEITRQRDALALLWKKDIDLGTRPSNDDYTRHVRIMGRAYNLLRDIFGIDESVNTKLGERYTINHIPGEEVWND